MKYILKFESASAHSTWNANNVSSDKYVHVAQIGGPNGNNYAVNIQYFRLYTGGMDVKGGETTK